MILSTQVLKNNSLTLLLTFVGILLFTSSAFAQEPSAHIQFDSQDKGLLVPRMSSAQRAAISNPADELMVYDSSQHVFYFFNQSKWQKISIVSLDMNNNLLTGTDSIATGLNNTVYGVEAGENASGDNNVRIGYRAGQTSSGSHDAVAVGNEAGLFSQDTSAIAVGSGAGRSSQGN